MDNSAPFLRHCGSAIVAAGLHTSKHTLRQKVCWAERLDGGVHVQLEKHSMHGKQISSLPPSISSLSSDQRY
jgi:hypothetical protein